MSLKTKLAAVILMAGSVSMAHATSYTVSSKFNDGGIQGQTDFNGTFDWDGASVTNFTGFLSQSMWTWDSSLMGGTGDFKNMGGMGAMGAGVDAYGNGPYANGDAPLLKLNHQLASSVSGGMVTASVFLRDDGMGIADTNVVNGDAMGSGGYDVTTPTWGSLKYGTTGGGTVNENAFFTLIFDAADPLNTMGLASSAVYGDCTALGLMGPMLTGGTCMTGFDDGTNTGSMGGDPASLTISEVSAVPVPAAAWLFGSALMGLFGVNRNRRKGVSAA